MSETVKQNIMVLGNYGDVVYEAADAKLTERYYFLLGFLKGTVTDGDRLYSELDDNLRQDVMDLYNQLTDWEHELSPAGSNA